LFMITKMIFKKRRRREPDRVMSCVHVNLDDIYKGEGVNLTGLRAHTGLTRVSSIWFLQFEIKRVLVFTSIIIYFTDLFTINNFIQNAYDNKKVFYKKG